MEGIICSPGPSVTAAGIEYRCNARLKYAIDIRRSVVGHEPGVKRKVMLISR